MHPFLCLRRKQIEVCAINPSQAAFIHAVFGFSSPSLITPKQTRPVKTGRFLCFVLTFGALSHPCTLQSNIHTALNEPANHNKRIGKTLLALRSQNRPMKFSNQKLHECHAPQKKL